MASLNQFSRRMRELGRRVEENGPTIARRTALIIDQVVVVATPVDEGIARSNWQASLGTPVLSEINAYVPGNEGSTGNVNAQAAINQARGVINTFRGEGEIYISNPLAYIGRLNEGSSAQAPANFVEQSISLGVQSVRRERVLDR